MQTRYSLICSVRTRCISCMTFHSSNHRDLLCPHVCATDATTITRLGDPAFNKSRRRFVKRKWPRWLTPICISKPSDVYIFGHAITPALQMSMLSIDSSSWNLQLKSWFFLFLINGWINFYLLENSRMEASEARSSWMKNTLSLPLCFFISLRASVPRDSSRHAM